MRNTLIAVVIMCAVLAGAFLFSRQFMRVPKATQDPGVFGAYSLILKDYDGKEVHLYEYRRKVLIAYAWASWCTYCGAELENLSKEKGLYGSEVQIVAINRAESRQDAKNFTDKLNLSFPIVFLLDPEDQFFKTIGGYAMPETVFIDEKGEIDFHQRGPIKIEEVDKKIQEVLN